MKVLYCYISIGSEGSKIHIDSFTRAFTSLGEEIIDAGILSKPFLEDKAKWTLTKILYAKIKWIEFNIRQFCKLYRLAVKYKPDVLIFRFEPNHYFFISICGLSYFYPVILEINATRSIEDPTRAKWLNNILEILTLAHARYCFTVSQVMKDHIIHKYRLNKDKFAVIENGVDIELFGNNSSIDHAKNTLGLNSHFVVGFVGAFKPWHGVETLIDLAESMRDLNIKFMLVGDGESKRTCEDQVKEKGLEDIVIFTGYVPHNDVAYYIAAMDVVMAPFPRAHYEQRGGFYGSALKIFEYMAMAKPIIAPPLGQIKEVIVDGDSGMLVYSENKNQLKEVLLHMYHDKCFREALGTNARKRVEKDYTWHANAEKVQNLCRLAIK